MAELGRRVRLRTVSLYGVVGSIPTLDTTVKHLSAPLAAPPFAGLVYSFFSAGAFPGFSAKVVSLIQSLNLLKLGDLSVTLAISRKIRSKIPELASYVISDANFLLVGPLEKSSNIF